MIRNDGGFELQRKQVLESSRLNLFAIGYLSLARSHDGTDLELCQIMRDSLAPMNIPEHTRENGLRADRCTGCAIRSGILNDVTAGLPEIHSMHVPSTPDPAGQAVS